MLGLDLSSGDTIPPSTRPYLVWAAGGKKAMITTSFKIISEEFLNWFKVIFKVFCNCCTVSFFSSFI